MSENTTSPTATYLANAIMRSGKTQRKIALAAGFPKPNMISMMKLGQTKVPIDRIPSLAKACGADPREFLITALREYHPDVWQVIETTFAEVFGPGEEDAAKHLRSPHRLASGKRGAEPARHDLALRKPTPEEAMLLDAAMVAWAHIVGWNVVGQGLKNGRPLEGHVAELAEGVKRMCADLGHEALRQHVRDLAPSILEGWHHARRATGAEFWEGSFDAFVVAYLHTIVDWTGAGPKLPSDWLARTVRLWTIPHKGPCG